MQMINSSRVLVLAMLSSASGWGLPSHDPLLSWNDTGEVDGARDQRQLHDSCTGITTVANSPFGAYAAENIAVTFPKITDLNDVPFTLELSFVNGGQPRHFTGGAFEGSKFSLQRTSPSAGAGAPGDIEWCPNQNYFLVTAYGVTNTLVYTPSCDHSWSVSPPRACPVHCPCVTSHCPCLSAATGLVTSSPGLATAATPAARGPGGQLSSPRSAAPAGRGKAKLAGASAAPTAPI